MRRRSIGWPFSGLRPRAASGDERREADLAFDPPINAPRPNCARRGRPPVSGTESCTAGMAAPSPSRAGSPASSRSTSVVRHLEDQLVVDLQQHPRRRALALRQRRLHADHGAADDVGGRALDRRVDRGALDEGALGRVLTSWICGIVAPCGRRCVSTIAVARATGAWSRPCSRGCRGSARNSCLM